METHKPMALAICYQELACERKLHSYEELAQLGRLTRSRVSLMLLLTNLAPAIQEEVLFLPKVISGPFAWIPAISVAAGLIEQRL